jgi:cleavage stimulation factor subunit 2
MMFDKETGKSKGYAFVEYPDVETASSAVRNLNNYSIGNRQLKCDFSRENTLSSAGENSLRGKNEDTLPPLPPGASLQPGQSYTDAITVAVSSLDKTRVEQIVTDVKKMASRNPVLMENLLAQCPQLSYAIVAALVQAGKTDTNVISQVFLNSNPEQPLQQQHHQQQQQEPQQVQEKLSTEQIALIKEVLAIPDDEVHGLPEEQKVMILQIKEDYKNGVYGTVY